MIIDLDDHLVDKHALKLTPCLELFRQFLNPAIVKQHKGGETPLCGIARVGLKGGQNSLEFNFEQFLKIEIR